MEQEIIQETTGISLKIILLALGIVVTIIGLVVTILIFIIKALYTYNKSLHTNMEELEATMEAKVAKVDNKISQKAKDIYHTIEVNTKLLSNEVHELVSEIKKDVKQQTADTGLMKTDIAVIKKQLEIENK